MPNEVSFLPAARDEFQSAVDFYERQQTGLGNQFADEVEKTLNRITTDPESYEILADHIHRYRVSRFPYAVLYHIPNDNQILVVAVMHLHRCPGYWQKRVSDS